MCKLVIAQGDYHKIELEFDDTTEASAMVEHLIPYATKKTTFTITCEVEEVEKPKGE